MVEVVAVIEVPFNSSAVPGGVAHMPRALARAGMYKVLSAHVEIVGREVEIPIGSPDRGASGLKAEASLVSMVESLSEVVGAAMAECHWPTIIGGDCSVLLGALLGERLAGESAGLLFVDGHEDAWPPHDSLTGEAAD